MGIWVSVSGVSISQGRLAPRPSKKRTEGGAISTGVSPGAGRVSRLRLSAAVALRFTREALPALSVSEKWPPF